MSYTQITQIIVSDQHYINNIIAMNANIKNTYW